MKRNLILAAVAIVSLSLVFTFSAEVAADSHGEASYGEHWELLDGDYRGSFMDHGVINISLQVTIEDEEIVDVSMRHQEYDGVDYYEEDVSDTFVGIREQYESALEYLVGAQGLSEINERLGYLEGTPEGTPALEEIEPEEVDGFTAATIRSSKVVSAVRDAFNRGRYRE